MKWKEFSIQVIRFLSILQAIFLKNSNFNAVKNFIETLLDGLEEEKKSDMAELRNEWAQINNKIDSPKKPSEETIVVVCEDIVDVVDLPPASQQLL